VNAHEPQGGLALLERAKSGDNDAFGALAEEHRASLYRLCYKMTGSPEEAEDLVQETLLKAFTHIAEFELRSSLSTWLHRIATNVTLDHQRSRKPWDLENRWEWFRERAEFADKLEQTMFMSPERSAEVREVAATCINCITMSLPAKQRATIVLCDNLGFSREDAANAIGASVASVKTELHRARKTMTEVFETRCALVNPENECTGCHTAGRIRQQQRAQEKSARTQETP
jgi:RNA polymerase sigma-70 factor (ECF subfamily)